MRGSSVGGRETVRGGRREKTEGKSEGERKGREVK